MFTEDGRDRLGGALLDLLEGGSLEVGDGSGATAEAPISERELVEGEVRVAADFDGSTGNFEWRHQAVKLSDGTVIDEDDEDQGRKVEGSAWTLEVFIDVVGGSDAG